MNLVHPGVGGVAVEEECNTSSSYGCGEKSSRCHQKTSMCAQLCF